MTALADAEPITGAQHRLVQRLQWFLSESTWDHERVNQQRAALLQADPAAAPHAQGVLVIDDTGDRKDGSATAHAARQDLGSVGKTDNVSVPDIRSPHATCAYSWISPQVDLAA